MTTAETARTALIVDDEDQLRRLMSRVLSKAGIRTLLAESASEARALFETYESEIDLLLLDVTLRDGDGAEQLLPEFVARKPAAIAIVTSGDEPPTALAEELKRIGGAFLRKPFVPKELLRLVEIPTDESTTKANAPKPGPA